MLDGYSSNGFYHFNWGWSGAYDGYFALTDLKPSGAGIGGNLKGYNYSQNIISYIKPAEEGEAEADADNVELSVLKPLIPGRWGDDAILIKSSWKNLTGHEIKVDMAWKIQDATAGTAQYVMARENEEFKVEGGWDQISLSLNKISKDGDYLVSLVTRAAGDSNAEWMDSKAQKDLTNYFHVSLSKGVYTYSPGESMQYDLQNIELAGGALYDQHLFGVTFKATNNNDIGLARHYVVNCYDPIHNQTYNDYDGCYVNLQPGESKDVVVSVKQWACYTDNVLELTLYEKNTESEVAVLGPYTVVADNFSYDSFELSMSLEDSDNVDKNNIKYSYTIDLYEGVFSGEVGVGILPGDVDYGSQSGIIAYGPTDFVAFYNPEVFTGDNQPMHISKSGVMSFPEGVVNTSYYLLLYYTTYKDDFVARWMEPFTIGNYEEGVEDVVADSATPIVNYDRSTGRINVAGSSNITKVDVYTVAGAGLGVPVALDGVNASVDVSAVGGSIIIVRVVDASGNVTCQKFGI